jgi:hypothetical protein
MKLWGVCMKKIWFVAMATLGFVTSCGDGGGSGGSLMSRCDSWCGRRNADPECDPGADINCPATCGAFAINATNTSCTAQADVLLDCFKATPDLCQAGMAAPCNTENTALVQCQNAAVADAGP